MKDQLKRILNLVRKTGDTMIVTDPDGEDVYVVMGLDRYEDLRNETGFDEEMAEDEWNRFEEEQKRLGDWDANSDFLSKNEEPEESVVKKITPKLAEKEEDFGEEQFYLEPIE